MALTSMLNIRTQNRTVNISFLCNVDLPNVLKKTCQQAIVESCMEPEKKKVELPRSFSPSTPDSRLSSPLSFTCHQPVTPKSHHQPMANIANNIWEQKDYCSSVSGSKSPSPVIFTCQPVTPSSLPRPKAYIAADMKDQVDACESECEALCSTPSLSVS